MSKTRDVVVTVPKGYWSDWLDEGDLPGDPETGIDWDFYTGGAYPVHAVPGVSRVYVVAHGRLRGYAPLVRVGRSGRGGITFVRRGGAVAVTIPETIRGFRGWRYRWWDREVEVPFPDWMDPEAKLVRRGD